MAFLSWDVRVHTVLISQTIKTPLHTTDLPYNLKAMSLLIFWSRWPLSCLIITFIFNFDICIISPITRSVLNYSCMKVNRLRSFFLGFLRHSVFLIFSSSGEHMASKIPLDWSQNVNNTMILLSFTQVLKGTEPQCDNRCVWNKMREKLSQLWSRRLWYNTETEGEKKVRFVLSFLNGKEEQNNLLLINNYTKSNSTVGLPACLCMVHLNHYPIMY